MTLGSEGRFLLVYSSQTGQAQAIAEEFAEKATDAGLQPDIHCIGTTEKKFCLEREQYAVIITSTTGDGEPPDNSLKWWRRLRKKTLPDDHFAKLRYAILGLGDSNYTNYCKCGKSFNERLLELGAVQWYPPHWADEATGLETVVEPWMDGLLKFLKEYFHIPEGATGVTSDHTPLPENHVALPEINNAPESENATTRTEDHNAPTEDSISASLPPLSEAALTVPLMPPAFLELNYSPSEPFDHATVTCHQNSAALPSAETPLSRVLIAKSRILTSKDALKTTVLLQMDISGCDWKYNPGDSVGVVCPNRAEEVHALIDRLDALSTADVTMDISLLKDTKKRRARVPDHFPSPCSLRHLLTYCCDIRAVPSKALLRVLVEHASDVSEKRRLQELCSKQGAEHFLKYVRSPSLGLMDVLAHFPSCQPPVVSVLEQLPRLMPRPYSVCSSPLSSPNEVEVVFNIIDIPAGDGRATAKSGLCTGWMHRLTSHTDSLVERIENLTLEPKPEMRVYLRNQHHFCLPADPSIPIILIGPGTGVAPFVGFLRHRAQLETSLGKSWLFYGCRHPEKDFLFKDEIHSFVESETLSKLLVSFSRDERQKEGDPRYVQDNIRLHGDELYAMLNDENAMVFVCGDAKGMAKGVNEAFVDVIRKCTGKTAEDAAAYIMQMRLERRFLEDVWT